MCKVTQAFLLGIIRLVMNFQNFATKLWAFVDRISTRVK